MACCGGFGTSCPRDGGQAHALSEEGKGTGPSTATSGERSKHRKMRGHRGVYKRYNEMKTFSACRCVVNISIFLLHLFIGNFSVVFFP